MPASHGSTRRAFTIIGHVLLAIPLVAATLSCALILYARSEGGRERLRRLVLEKAHAAVPGLELGGIGGDCVHDLVFNDVTVRDRAGRPAVHVERIVARFSLIPLLHKRLFVRELLVHSPSVLGRPEDDGSMNLAHMITGAEPKPEKEMVSQGSSLAIQVDRIVVMNGSADVLTAAGQHIAVSALELSGKFGLDGPVVRAQLDALSAQALVDDRDFELDVKGRAMISPSELHAVIDRLVLSGALPRGDVVLSGEAGGPRSDLGFHVQVSLPSDASVDARGRVALTDAGLGAYQAEVVGNQVNPQALVETAPPGRVSWRLRAQGSGTPLAPGSRVVGTLVVPPSRLAGLQIREVDIAGGAEGDAWSITRAVVRGAGAELALQGHGRDKEIAANLHVTIGDPSDGSLPTPDFRGRGALTAKLSGTIPSQVDFEATAIGKKLEMGTARIASLRMQARGSASNSRRRLSINANASAEIAGVMAGGAKIQQAKLVGHASGNARTPSGSVKLSASGIYPSPGAPPIDRLVLNLASDGRNLRLHGSGAGAQAKVALDATGVVSERAADITLKQLAVDLRSPKLKQNITLRQPTTIRWRADDRIELGEMAVHAAGAKLSGDLRASGMYRLDPQQKLDPRGRVSVSVKKLAIEGLDPLDMDASVDLRRDKALFKLRATMAKATLQVDADVPVRPGRNGAASKLSKDGPIAVLVKSNQFNLQELPVLNKHLARRGLIGGTVSLIASLQGDVKHPDAKMTFDVQDLEFRKVTGVGRDAAVHRIPGVGASLKLDTRRGAINLTGQALLYGAGFVVFDTHLRTDVGDLLAGQDIMAAPLELDVNIPKFQLSSLKDWDDSLRDTEGVLSGYLALRGTLRKPTGKGDLSIQNARVDKLRFGGVQAHAVTDGNNVKAKLEVQQVQGGSMMARATFGRGSRQTLNASVTLKQLDVSFARLFAPGVREIAGVVDGDVRASGTVAEPRIEGKVYYYNGRLGVVGQPTVHGIGATVAFKPERVELEKLSAYSGSGSLTGKGWLTLDGLSPTGMVLTAHADRFLLAAAGSSGARLDGDLAVAAELNDNLVKGKVNVPQASLWLPKVGIGGRKVQAIGQHDDVRFIDPAALAAAETQKQAGSQSRRLDIQAVAGTIFVRGQDLDIELESNLRVTTGTGGNPVINGTVQIRRGRINITGQRFDFDHGQISFDGHPNPNPRLAIRISHQYPDALVAVEIHGTAQQPQVRLVSDPPIYDQAQIVSLILTGQPGGQPSTGGSFDPTAAVANLVLGKLADKIAPELGLDILRVEAVKDKSTDAGGNGATETRVEIGKYISERVYLSYGHVFGATENQNKNEAHVEYRMTRRWLVETVFGDAGVGGADAMWSYRY